MIVRTPRVFREKQNIETYVSHEVREIDIERQRIRVQRKEDGKTWWEPYDHLMIATGSVPIRIPVQGSDSEGIFGVNTYESGIKLNRFLDDASAKNAVVIGGGYIGLEMAENLIKRGLSVSLVELNKEVMSTLDPDMGKLVSDALIEIGVKLFREERFEGFETDNGRVRAVVTDKRTLPADVVVLGMGVRPNTELAQKAGIPIGPSKGIRVNPLLQTDVENVWAGGDCAESIHLVSGKPVHIPLGTVANKHGRVAGINIGGGYATFPGVVGTAMSKICAVEVARTGLGEKEVQRIGLHYITSVTRTRTRAGYYPNADSISVKLIAEKNTGRLLGAQIVGREGAAKRIDILATALHRRMNLQEIMDLDLSYAPPYSPVWDPVALAARVALKKLQPDT
ncbi:MAG: FAD-dependent oxidoreductase [Desulfobacterales bacterium]